MTINELNSDILFEKSMAELADEFAIAKTELRTDIDVRITLEAIKEFVKKWQYFTKNFSVSKQRITVIQEKGAELLKYLQARIDKLKKVKMVDKDEIEPMQNYLDSFKIEVESHIEISKIKYSQAGRAN